MNPSFKTIRYSCFLLQILFWTCLIPITVMGGILQSQPLSDQTGSASTRLNNVQEETKITPIPWTEVTTHFQLRGSVYSRTDEMICDYIKANQNQSSTFSFKDVRRASDYINESIDRGLNCGTELSGAKRNENRFAGDRYPQHLIKNAKNVKFFSEVEILRYLAEDEAQNEQLKSSFDIVNDGKEDKFFQYFQNVKIYFEIEENFDGIRISGQWHPIKFSYNDALKGPAIVKFTRLQDNKTFEMPISEFSAASARDCKNALDILSGELLYTKDEFICELPLNIYISKSKLPESMEGSLPFWLNDVDFDGKKELIYEEKNAHKGGSRITAFNFLNDNNGFQLEPDAISIDYLEPGVFFDLKNKTIFYELAAGCCRGYFEEYQSAKGSYKLKSGFYYEN